MIMKLQEQSDSAILFPLWLAIGIAIYATYGYKKNRELENKKEIENKKETSIKKIGV